MMEIIVGILASMLAGLAYLFGKRSERTNIEKQILEKKIEVEKEIAEVKLENQKTDLPALVNKVNLFRRNRNKPK